MKHAQRAMGLGHIWQDARLQPQWIAQVHHVLWEAELGENLQSVRILRSTSHRPAYLSL